ncbi:sensor histidine kinase [Radiobacillus kanasensis]|uniref:sensor histidine kinase n=1 Tax=Radiobacillus kanasensis TaxID=2844358 RepID=UPI001E31DA77|nr:sensor histidine kinase [Radiobacillus kanasensis]UFT99649.1 sensor histidine kinase [Radiobacillus kanasensis]
MQHWYHIFPKNTGLSLYVWLIFCILPFYFIFRSSHLMEIIFGIVMIVLFFVSYRLSFLSRGKGSLVYICVGMEMVISIVMTLLFGYIYFSLFLAFFIGNIQSKSGFISLYVVHLVLTIAAIAYGFITDTDAFLTQFPFLIISLIGIILIPVNMFNRVKREKLEGELEQANQRISELMVLEERQRIARDLHDTLGQKLSLIGLKSELASKLIHTKPETSENELKDIHQTARTALKEVRELVSDMRGARLVEELVRVKQILIAADIQTHMDGFQDLQQPDTLIENVLSMCLKEAVTNVVKHSQADHCYISIQESTEHIELVIRDDGVGFTPDSIQTGNGLVGMRERLEFVNGTIDLLSSDGTILKIRIPNVIKQRNQEEPV